MTTHTLRTLRGGDADIDALLAFELANRDWFERHVAPRGDDFYTPCGVRAHIASCLDGLEQGTWHACLIVDAAGTILGRANLKEIDRQAGTAEIGYRLAEHAAGKGLATLVVRDLGALAASQWRLRQLTAWVLTLNPASVRVLEKNGYRRGASRSRIDQIDGDWYDGWQFMLDLESR